MKKLAIVCALTAMLAIGFSLANAQTPIVQIVFDQDLVEQTHVCTPSTMDSAFVVAKNFNIWMVGIEFAIEYPASVSWIADTDTPELVIGTSPSGISMAWQTPKNAYDTLKIMKILYFCNSCPDDTPIRVIPHPVSGYVRATEYPDLDYVYAIGWTSIFCPNLIPVENTTWGNVKSMYQ